MSAGLNSLGRSKILKGGLRTDDGRQTSNACACPCVTPVAPVSNNFLSWSKEWLDTKTKDCESGEGSMKQTMSPVLRLTLYMTATL